MNVVSPSGLTAVLMAAVSSCDDGVKALVEAGADVGLIVTGNITVLHISAEHGLLEAVRAIIRWLPSTCLHHPLVITTLLSCHYLSYISTLTYVHLYQTGSIVPTFLIPC